jgi:hypothetical protein
MTVLLQNVENMKVTLQLVNNILQNDAVNLIQFRVFLFQLRQNIILENLMFQTVIVDRTAFVEATKQFAFDASAWIQPKTGYLNHFLL